MAANTLPSVPLARLAFWIWQPSDSSFTSSSLAGTRAWHSQRIHFINQTGWTLGLGTAFNFITSFNQLAVWRRLSKLLSTSTDSSTYSTGWPSWHRLSNSIINLTGLAFGVWQPMHSSLYFFFCSGGFQYPRPFTSCVVVKCLDRRLNSSFQLYSRPMRPIPNHNSL